MPDIPKRKNLRLQNFDYNTPGAYFITICTHNKKCILSDIVGGDVLDAPRIELSSYGQIADKYINKLGNFYDDIAVDCYVIMPNHIHIILRVLETGMSRTPPPTKQHSTVSRFVSAFKRFSNRESGINIWQRGYHDHIIRGNADYEEILNYVQNNPIRWVNDRYYEEKR